ncbi:1785_t:CDS:2, partial [Paraglomus occultum]
MSKQTLTFFLPLGYSIMTYNQSVAPTPNFGSTRNDAWIDPDKPPCTQSFVSVVVDPTNYAKIFDPKSKLFYAWDAQSCITTCVDTCMKTDPLNSPQAAAWCIVVSNPNNGATAFLRISYTFDPTAFISTSIAGSTSTVSSTSIGSSTAITSSTSTDTHA